MLPGAYIGPGAGASVAGAGLSYLTSSTSASNLNTYTFSSQDVGAAAADRYIIVAAHARDTTSISGSPTITVGGQSVTNLVTTGSSSRRVTIGIAALTTGTTADVVVTNGQVCEACGIGLWRVTGLDSTTPVDTGTSTTVSSSSVSLSTTAGGFIVAACTNAGSATNTVWTNVSERYDTSIEFDYVLGADYSGTSGASRTVTIEADPGESALYLAAVSMF